MVVVLEKDSLSQAQDGQEKVIKYRSKVLFKSKPTVLLEKSFRYCIIDRIFSQVSLWQAI